MRASDLARDAEHELVLHLRQAHDLTRADIAGHGLITGSQLSNLQSLRRIHDEAHEVDGESFRDGFDDAMALGHLQDARTSAAFIAALEAEDSRNPLTVSEVYARETARWASYQEEAATR